jgi:hypothetical protein
MRGLFKTESDKLLEHWGIPKKIEYWYFSDNIRPIDSKKYIVKIIPSMRDLGNNGGERIYAKIQLSEIINLSFKEVKYWERKIISKEVFSDTFCLTKENSLKTFLYNAHYKFGLEKKFISELFEPSICDLLNYKKNKFNPKNIKNCC